MVRYFFSILLYFSNSTAFASESCQTFFQIATHKVTFEPMSIFDGMKDLLIDQEFQNLMQQSSVYVSTHMEEFHGENGEVSLAHLLEYSEEFSLNIIKILKAHNIEASLNESELSFVNNKNQIQFIKLKTVKLDNDKSDFIGRLALAGYQDDMKLIYSPLLLDLVNYGQKSIFLGLMRLNEREIILSKDLLNSVQGYKTFYHEWAHFLMRLDKRDLWESFPDQIRIISAKKDIHPIYPVFQIDEIIAHPFGLSFLKQGYEKFGVSNYRTKLGQDMLTIANITYDLSDIIIKKLKKVVDYFETEKPHTFIDIDYKAKKALVKIFNLNKKSDGKSLLKDQIMDQGQINTFLIIDLPSSDNSTLSHLSVDGNSSTNVYDYLRNEIKKSLSFAKFTKNYLNKKLGRIFDSKLKNLKSLKLTKSEMESLQQLFKLQSEYIFKNYVKMQDQ